MKKYTILMFALLLAIPALQSFQIIKTQLHLTVRDNLGNLVENARVRLFETEDDYAKEENAVAEGYTDAKGIIKFKELKETAYFVLAEKDDMNNFGGGEKTGKLEGKRINKTTIVIQE